MSTGKRTNTTKSSLSDEKKLFAIANYFIEKNRLEKKGLTNKKLQKLLYYSQAWNLVLRNKKLFEHEIEAWVHGPAVPVVYFAYKDYGSAEITEEVGKKGISLLHEDEKELLDAVWDVYGKYDANYLELLAHSEYPWQEARKDTSPHEASDKVISTKTMRRFYGQKIEEAKSRAKG